jgi:DNA-binding response OmpR family regulator
VEAHILVVDDDVAIRELVREYLTEHDFKVSLAETGADMDKVLGAEMVDLVILDLKLPDEDGLAIARRLRESLDLPIIILTGRKEEADRIMGLELGADDYVTKPFSLRELTARVRAVLRRATPVGDRPPAGYRGTHLVADFEAVSVAVDGAAVRLTRREFELLRYLVQNKTRVVSRDRLLERVWGYERMVETRSVDVHVGRLRTKLGDAARQIETVIGLGYRFVD